MPLVTRTSNQGNLFKQALTPNWSDGDLWSDTTANEVKVNVSGTATAIGKQSFSSAAVVTHSTTIGDYTSPTAAAATSSATTPGVSVFGLNADQPTENFTTYTTQGEADTAWASTDTAKDRVNITNDNLDFNHNMATANKAISFDVGLVSETIWSIVFKINYSTLTASPSSDLYVGMSDHASSGSNTAQDFIGAYLGHRVTPTLGSCITDGAAPQNSAADQEAETWATGTDYWIRIQRTSATVVLIQAYSDAALTTLLADSTTSVTAGITGLRYFKIFNREDVTEAGVITGTIDDIYLESGSMSRGAASVIDGSVSSANYWQSNAEVNPAIYVDLGGAAANCLGMAIYLHANTTETEIQIRMDASTTFTSADAKRTITVSNLTAGAWNYIRWNLKTLRYLQVYGNSGASNVLAISEIKYLTKTDAQILQDLGILEISATDTGLGLDGI